MKGIEYVVDDRGQRRAVLIDLTLLGELWEDFYDTLIAEERKDGPRETLDEVRAKLGLGGG